MGLENESYNICQISKFPLGNKDGNRNIFAKFHYFNMFMWLERWEAEEGTHINQGQKHKTKSKDRYYGCKFRLDFGVRISIYLSVIADRPKRSFSACSMTAPPGECECQCYFSGPLGRGAPSQITPQQALQRAALGLSAWTSTEHNCSLPFIAALATGKYSRGASTSLLIRETHLKKTVIVAWKMLKV